MQTVEQRQLPIDGSVVDLALPGSARLARVEVHPIDPTSLLSWWYVSDVDAEPAEVRVAPLRTGQNAPAAWIYLATTAPSPRGGVVWHLWRVVDA